MVVKSKFVYSNKISIAAGVLEAMGLIKNVPGFRNVACWNEKNPYQILPEMWELQQSSTLLETSKMDLDPIDMRMEADSKKTEFRSEVESMETKSEVDQKRMSSRNEEINFRTDVDLKAMESDTQADSRKDEVGLLHYFEPRQVAEKVNQLYPQGISLLIFTIFNYFSD
jgi:hypothetical protein